MTQVVLDNEYPAWATQPLVVYRAYWGAVSFQEPVAPGASSDPQDTVAASANTAYAILAPGWAPTDASSALPTSFVLLQSREGFAVHLNDTLHIPVNDTTFAGNCAANSTLSQLQADFILQLVFTPNIYPDAAAPFTYDPATCTTSMP